MAYSIVPVNINESFSVSQPKITTNFAAINTVISVDHVTFDAAGQGKHKKVTLVEQAADQTTAANEMALYIKDAGAEPNLHLRKESDGTVFNMTPSTTGHATPAGYEVLPSGLKFKWGTGIIAGTVQSQDQNFATAFSTDCYHVQITLTSPITGLVDDGIMYVSGLTASKFIITRAMAGHYGTSVNYCYLAIGV